MKQIFLLLIITLFLLPPVAFSSEQQGPLQTFANGCEKELKTYCSDVQPGEGRLLACLYAHNDKVSGRCEYAIYDAAAQLERILSAVAYVANECDDDLVKFCGDIQVGEGRVIECMEKNKDKLSKRCKQAVDDTFE